MLSLAYLALVRILGLFDMGDLESNSAGGTQPISPGISSHLRLPVTEFIVLGGADELTDSAGGEPGTQ